MPGQRFLDRKNIFHVEAILRVLVLIRRILPFEKNQFLLAIFIVGNIYDATLNMEKEITGSKLSEHRAFSGPYFPAFGLNLDTFHAVNYAFIHELSRKCQTLLKGVIPFFSTF